MNLEKQVLQLAEKLQANNLRVATAESCTGGWVSQLFTSVAGSSSWFEGGIVSYSNEVKERLLGVPKSELDQHGAVSQVVAESMAKGAVKALQVPASVAITGVAGPGGGTPDKPVGTVWIAWCFDTEVRSELYIFDGDREQVRQQSVQKAVAGLNSFLFE